MFKAVVRPTFSYFSPDSLAVLSSVYAYFLLLLVRLFGCFKAVFRPTFSYFSSDSSPGQQHTTTPQQQFWLRSEQNCLEPLRCVLALLPEPAKMPWLHCAAVDVRILQVIVCCAPYHQLDQGRFPEQNIVCWAVAFSNH